MKNGGAPEATTIKYSSELINWTPHDVCVIDKRRFVMEAGKKVPGETIITYKAQQDRGVIRLIPYPQSLLGHLPNGICVYTPPALDDGHLDGFPYVPENKHHPDLIVSMVVGNAIPSWYRGNVYIPDTGPDSAIRDEGGRITGVARLCLVHKGRKNGLVKTKM